MAGSIHGQLLESLSVGRIIAAVFLFVTGAFVVDFALKPRYPKSLPRVGYAGALATLRNWIGYVMYFAKWVDEGYEKVSKPPPPPPGQPGKTKNQRHRKLTSCLLQYSKHDRAFVVPSAASRPEEIVVPRSQTAWMLERPDRVLSAHHAHNDVLYSEYNFLGKAFSDDVFHTRVIHRNLARHLPALIPAVEEEVREAMAAALGTDRVCWLSVILWVLWLAIVPRVTNRLMVGAPACRDADFLKCMEHFADTVVTNSFILNMFPKLLHPVVGRLVTIPNRRLWRRAHNIVYPVIAASLRGLAAKEAGDDPAYQDWEPPEDFITWDIRMAKAEGRASELDPATISKRLLPVEFAAIHTTVLTGHFVVMDLLSSV